KGFALLLEARSEWVALVLVLVLESLESLEYGQRLQRRSRLLFLGRDPVLQVAHAADAAAQQRESNRQHGGSRKQTEVNVAHVHLPPCAGAPGFLVGAAMASSMV